MDSSGRGGSGIPPPTARSITLLSPLFGAREGAPPDGDSARMAAGAHAESLAAAPCQQHPKVDEGVHEGLRPGGHSSTESLRGVLQVRHTGAGGGGGAARLRRLVFELGQHGCTTTRLAHLTPTPQDVEMAEEEEHLDGASGAPADSLAARRFQVRSMGTSQTGAPCCCDRNEA